MTLRTELLQQIVSIIQAEIAPRVSSSAGAVVSGTTVKPRTARSSKTKSSPRKQMARLITQRVEALDPSDPNRDSKAFRIFLESILLAEFGTHLMNDPQFFQLVDDIQHTMEQDVDIAGIIKQAVTQLLTGTAER